MQARRHSAIWTVNRRAAGLDWKSSGRFGAGDQGLRCPPPWRVNRTGAPARLRTPMAPKGVRLRSSALRHQRSRQAGRTPAPLRSLQASAPFRGMTGAVTRPAAVAHNHETRVRVALPATNPGNAKSGD